MIYALQPFCIGFCVVGNNHVSFSPSKMMHVFYLAGSFTLWVTFFLILLKLMPRSDSGKTEEHL